MNEGMFIKVRAFVAHHAGMATDTLDEHTRLAEDLGLDGEDAVELMSAFSKEFAVEMADFQFAEYFGPEGAFNPLLYLYCWLFDRQKLQKTSITVHDLVRAAEAARWMPPARAM